MDERCQEYRDKHQLPISQMNTNAAYRMAAEWLAAAHMDIDALNRDCKVRVQVNSFWNGLKPGEKRRKTFVPIYDVFWLSPKNLAENYGDTAYVCLFAPTKTLLDLNVRDSKYILRSPLVFTNLPALLQTNSPAQTKPQ